MSHLHSHKLWVNSRTGEPGRKAKSAMTGLMWPYKGESKHFWIGGAMGCEEERTVEILPLNQSDGDNQGNSPPIRTWECSGSRRAVCARLWGRVGRGCPSPTSQYPEHRCVMITQPPWLTDHQPTNSPSALEGEYPVSPRSFRNLNGFWNLGKTWSTFLGVGARVSVEMKNEMNGHKKRGLGQGVARVSSPFPFPLNAELGLTSETPRGYVGLKWWPHGSVVMSTEPWMLLLN